MNSPFTVPATVKVYGLHNGDKKIRYVGITTNNLSQRKGIHIHQARHGISKSPVSLWIAKELKKGKTISVYELDNVQRVDAPEAEKWWIKKLAANNLYNVVHTSKHMAVIDNRPKKRLVKRK